MNDREYLMQRIQMLDFALLDCGLFLNTHPCDPGALEYYRQHKEMRDMAKAEYQAIYGAVGYDDNQPIYKWEWCEGLWPWQKECEI